MSTKVLKHLPHDIQPVIGAWFWNKDDFKPDGYKHFIDLVNKHSCYDLLSTSIRIPGRDITDIDVHNQVKLAVEYAKEKGIDIALELDPRLARRKFEAAYPDELQESLWLKEITLSQNNPVETIIRSTSFSDHMVGRKTPYISLRGSLIRVYSYAKTSEGITPGTINDITVKCKVKLSSKDSLVVSLPENQEEKQLQACVMVSFTHLYPDVFAPHLIEFTNEIINNYADVPLAGGMRDEWGFPPSFGLTSGNQFWYSTHYAKAYTQKTGGRDLIFDCLLMYKGVQGRESERQMAINNYMELNRQRNEVLEDDFYNTIKSVFGKDASVVTHPTWYPYPNKMEYKKNGLDWWVAKRDWAQTDESTPFAVRTALSKKWGSPVWYNQYYSTKRKNYEHELWSSVLAGGRINYHPICPSNGRADRYIVLFRGDLMRGESRVRLLNFICDSPLNCPVAVVFGHPSAMNWTGPSFENLGMKLVDSLWSMGIPTDLIPTSEIENGSLLVDEKGWIHYGKQRYTVVILYNPEFEKLHIATFFNKAANGQTSLLRIGNWTRDFNGNSFNGNAALPHKMVVADKIETAIVKISKILNKEKYIPQTPTSRILNKDGNTSNIHPVKGFCRLIDGTLIQVAGENCIAGDTIDSKMKIGNYNVTFNAIGVAAVRLDEKGNVKTLAAGGLKLFYTRNFSIQLKKRVDIALWKKDNGEFEGVIQGYEGDIPQQLLNITKNWTRLNIPKPLNN